jgi:PBP1b-binding outer membrane lipoprotein LpoB
MAGMARVISLAVATLFLIGCAHKEAAPPPAAAKPGGENRRGADSIGRREDVGETRPAETAPANQGKRTSASVAAKNATET